MAEDFEIIKGADNGNPPDTLRQMYPKVNRNFENVKNTLASLLSLVTGHKESTIAHPAENITYSGEAPGANVKQAIDGMDNRIDNLILESGDSNPEVVDARNPATGTTYATLKTRLDTENNNLTARLADKANKRWFDVMDFGTLGDGVNDDTSAIQAAIDAAKNAGGGLVFIPKGIFLITSQLDLYPNIIIRGAGREVSFVAPSTINQTVFSIVNQTLIRSYTAIEDIGIKALVSGARGIYSVLASAMRYQSLYFGGCETNFHIDRGSNIQISHVLVEGVTSPNLKAGRSIFEDSSVGSHLYDLELVDYQIRNIGNGCASPALTLNRVVGSMVRGFHVNDLAAGGGNADGILITGDCQGVQISDSIIVKPYQYGVKLSNASGSSPIAIDIDSVDVDQALNDAIYLETGFWVNINGGQISSFQKSGVYLGATNVLIQGITFSDGGIDGIRIKAGINHFRVLGNHIEGCDNAILIEPGSSSAFSIMNNHMLVNNTNRIVDGSTGTSKIIRYNIGGSDVLTKEYVVSATKTLTGGSTSEDVVFTIPSGIFSSKPFFVSVMGQSPVSDFLVGFYDYDNTANSATQVTVKLTRLNGGTIGAGTRRFGIIMKG